MRRTKFLLTERFDIIYELWHRKKITTKEAKINSIKLEGAKL